MKNRQARIGIRGLVFWAFVLVLLAVGSRFEGFVEFHAANITPLASRFLGAVSGFVPFSVAELVLVSVVMFVLVGLLRGIVAVVQRRRSIVRVLFGWLRRLLVFALVSITIFYGLWGVQYARRPLPLRQNWSPGALDPGVASQVLEVLSRELVEHVNDIYRQLHGTEDLGSPTGEGVDVSVHDSVLDRAHDELALILGDATLRGTRPQAKPVYFSGVLSKVGISGFFFPWTGEANYNRSSPGWQQPHVVAHEKAHQRGVTSEDEANFLGFLACAVSGQDLVRYSGYLFAQRQLLSQLAIVDRELANSLASQRIPGVQRDLDHAREYWLGQVGLMTEVGSRVNDAYLRAHRVEGGILSYRRVVRLLVLFGARKGPPTLILP